VRCKIIGHDPKTVPRNFLVAGVGFEPTTSGL
jgi:hypothetical protein